MGPDLGVPRAAAAGVSGAQDPPIRATVRYRIDPPPPPGQPALTDVVGTVLRNTPQDIVVKSRRGVVHIPRELVVATRIIASTPTRRGVVGGGIEPLALHRLVAPCWPATETTQVGDWLLRASGGFTSRANSVVPVGDPGLPWPAALAEVEQWYAVRSLPSNLTLAGPMGFDPAKDPLGSLLISRGYRRSDSTIFLTAPPDAVRRVIDGTTPTQWTVRVEPELSAQWLTAYQHYRPVAGHAAEAVLTGSPQQFFATAQSGEAIVGVARLGVSAGWGGIAAMWVDPAYRRRQVATALIGELVTAATQTDVTALHLQVLVTNPPALALYEKLGFRRHHEYVNLVRAL